MDAASEGVSRRERRRQEQENGSAPQPPQDETKEPTLAPMDGYLRRAPRGYGSPRNHASSRAPPLRAPEVHLIGEIKFGHGFGPGVSCKWRVDYGKHWGVLEGIADGHTQTAYGPENTDSVWNHPIDLHFQTTTMQGWPKLIVQIQELDSYGRVHVIAHGFAHLPCSSGAHAVSVPCWRATGTQEEELRAFFLGEYPVLLDEDLVYHKATSNRHRLVTVPSGTVSVEFNVIARYFSEYGVDST